MGSKIDFRLLKSGLNSDILFKTVIPIGEGRALTAVFGLHPTLLRGCSQPTWGPHPVMLDPDSLPRIQTRVPA